MKDVKRLGFFERYLTLWVGLCIVFGIILGRLAPGLAVKLDGMSIFVNGRRWSPYHRRLPLLQ
jgi:ACR3 family arsenite transporter